MYLQPLIFNMRSVNYSYITIQQNAAFFYITSGESRTYRFKIRFYSLSDMPAEIQKAIDYTQKILQNIFCFLKMTF